MALSYLTESEAPRDFRISSTESDSHYTKCVLCYAVRKNFYCVDCIRTGNFVHSSMPYSERFFEKQTKLLRLKANRKHVLDRCEKLLACKLKKDSLQTEAKLSRDKLDLLRLAIEQRKNKIDENRKELSELKKYNNDLHMKLPRYQKRVLILGKHVEAQKIELQKKVSSYNDQAHSLSALRRSRIRQLSKYIFPVYMTYDTSDSIEDIEIVGSDVDSEPAARVQLHIVTPWIDTDSHFTHICTWGGQQKEAAAAADPGDNPMHRTSAALGLAAQLLTLLAWTLDTRLPHPLPLSEYCSLRPSSGTSSRSGVARGVRRLCVCCAALCLRAGLPPPAPTPPARSLAGLHSLVLAAGSDEPTLGRTEAWMSSSVLAAGEAWEEARRASGEVDADGEGELEGDDSEPPEHLHWPETMEMEETSSSPPGAAGGAPLAAALVTSAAASIASMWRGWTK